MSYVSLRSAWPWPVVLAVTCLLVTALAPAALAQEPPAEAMVVIEGRGWGHGVGMAQDGALALGRQGESTAGILQHFYPGTAMGSGGGVVRVAVLDAAGNAVVSFPGGGEVRSPREGPQAPGFPVSVTPGGSVRLVFDGAYRVEPLTGATVAALGDTPPTVLAGPGAVAATQAPGNQDAPAPDDGGLIGGLIGPNNPPPENSPQPPAPAEPPPGETVPPPAPEQAPAPDDEEPPPENTAVSSSALWAVPGGGGTTGVAARSARYRGVVQAVAGGNGLRLINEVDVEEYLRGMGEVIDSSWPQPALGAQAVAARTYALRTMALGGEICDTQACQVYLGAQAEYGAMNSAVAATRGQVVVHGGRLAQTVYSASGGGVSATPQEGFGTSNSGLPYLTPVSYPTADPRAWNLTLTLGQLGRRLGYRGTLGDVRIATTGPSGRALTVELLGDSGPQEISALAFDDTLGLRSTNWTLRVDRPPPPPPGAEDQGAAVDAGSLRLPGSAAAGTPPGRLLPADDLFSVATLSGLRGPLRAAAAMASVALLLGMVGGAAFRLIARRAPARPVPVIAGDEPTL